MNIEIRTKDFSPSERPTYLLLWPRDVSHFMKEILEMAAFYGGENLECGILGYATS
jgi:hypothetical protein